MQYFWFEVVRTVEGQPDPGSYESGLSHNPRFDTSGKMVLEKFPDEETARMHAVEHEGGWLSDVWCHHCPPMFQDGKGVGGLDVFYIGPCEFDSEGRPITPVYQEKSAQEEVFSQEEQFQSPTLGQILQQHGVW